MNKRGVTNTTKWNRKTNKSTHLWHTDCTSVADRRLFRLVTSLWFWLRLSFFLLRGCHSSVFIAVAVCSAHFFASWSCGPCTSTRRRFVAFSSRIAIFYRLNRLFLLSTSYLGFVDVPLFVAFGWKRWQCSLFGHCFLRLRFSVRHFVARNDNCSLGKPQGKIFPVEYFVYPLPFFFNTG